MSSIPGQRAYPMLFPDRGNPHVQHGFPNIDMLPFFAYLYVGATYHEDLTFLGSTARPMAARNFNTPNFAQWTSRYDQEGTAFDLILKIEARPPGEPPGWKSRISVGTANPVGQFYTAWEDPFFQPHPYEFCTYLPPIEDSSDPPITGQLGWFFGASCNGVANRYDTEPAECWYNPS